MADDDDTVTHWVEQLKGGDRDALQPLWERYFRRLVALARGRLQGLPRQAADEEDVALSAFNSFWKAAEAGRFPQLNDRDDLWQLLVMVTTRKAVDLRMHEGRDKRNWRRVQAIEPAQADASGAYLLANLLQSPEPDPKFAAEMADACQQLLDKLPDEQLRQIAVLKLEGFTNRDIAIQLGVAEATVERRLARIRRNWQN